MGLQTIVYSKIILQILQPASNFEGANSIYGNKIVKTTRGIIAQWASYSIIYGNDITNNEYGVYLKDCSNSSFYHNNFINNTQHVYDKSWSFPSKLASFNYFFGMTVIQAVATTGATTLELMLTVME